MKHWSPKYGRIGMEVVIAIMATVGILTVIVLAVVGLESIVSRCDKRN